MLEIMISRSNFRRAVLVLVLGSLPMVHPAAAGNWQQWRGPHRDGKSAETGLLQEWPEGGPPLSWKATGLGTGYSSLAVVGDRIFTMGDLEDGQYVLALERDGGKMVWKTKIGPVHEDKRGGPRATPTVGGDLVYVVSTEGDVVALEAAIGTERWRRSLTEDYEAYLMKAMGSYDWKFCESPLVDGDRVIVTPGHVRALMVALNRETGEEIWKTQGRRLGPLGADGTAYSSIRISEAAGVRQYVQMVGRGLIGVEAETGKLLWNYNRVANDIANIATPIVHDDHVLASTGYGTGTGLVKIVRAEEGFEAEEVYFLEAKVVQNHHGGLILHDGTVFTGTGHNKGFPIAFDLISGEVRWGPERNDGADSATATYADGRIYLRYQDGRMILIDADDGEYKERGTFVIPEVVKASWSHPAIADGILFLREQDNLFAYDIRAQGKSKESQAGR